MISLQNIRKTYGKGDSAFVALQDISFDIATGDTVSIIGKSGSGKSTLMHVMSGLDHPSSGTITIDDVDISKMPRRRMDDFRAQTISFIFQSFFVEANQTCYQNVALPLEIAGMSHRERSRLISEALDAVELGDKRSVLAGNLSGGQKQRLAIARAIVGKPRILFADEPTGNLDTVTGELVMKLLFDLNKKLGCTLIIVTHDEELARRCNTRINLRDGSLVSLQTTERKVAI